MNYRPVMLTSQLSKDFDSIVGDEVVIFSESCEVIKNTQHRFRKSK